MRKIFFIVFLFYQFSVCSQTWQPLSPLLYGIGGPANIYTLKVYDNKLTIGGTMMRVGNWVIGQLSDTRPITWNGSVYETIPGFQHIESVISNFEEFNGKLYFSGYFQHANNVPNTKYIACFNGTGIEALANVIPNSMVRALKSSDYLFLGGDFPYIGGTLYRNIARYNGTTYSTVGGGFQDMLPHIWALEIYNNQLVAGGTFAYAGTGFANNIASWNGTTWDNMKNGLNGTVHDLSLDSINNFLYVSGDQNQIGNGSFVSSIVRWNGYYWEDTGFPANLYSSHICIYHKELYSSIYIPSVTDIDTVILKYDGVTWINVPGLNSDVNDMCVYNDDLYIGGFFTKAGNDSVNGIVALHDNPPTDCNWLMPRVFTNADTFYLGTGQADVQFYNNNAYAQSWQWDFGDTGTGNIKDPLHTYTQSGTYTAIVTVTMDGCTKTAQKTITVLNGNEVQEYTKENLNFKLYPNPTSGDITVEVTLSGSKSAELRAFSNSGTLQDKYDLTKGYNKVTIPASQWPNGLSLVGLFINGKQVFVEKVIIQK